MNHAQPTQAGTHVKDRGPDIADIFRRFGEKAKKVFRFTVAQLFVLSNIIKCRTAALGGHNDACDNCGLVRPSYNSCRDRHCPKCQAPRQAQWIAVRQERLLPAPHYHIVFTVPGALRPIAKADRRAFFDILFRAASKTLLRFGQDPKWIGGQIGITAVLHTWTRELKFHPHIHAIVTAGAFCPKTETWLKPKGGKNFIFPCRALASVFRRKVIEALVKRDIELRIANGQPPDPRFTNLMHRLRGIRWVIHTKQPFQELQHIVQYLGRYTHRVGISNQRIIAIDDDGITFRTRGNDTTRISPVQFIARFLEHVLPEGFAKIRHYGLYSPGNVNKRLAKARELLPAPTLTQPPGPPTVTYDENGKLQVMDVRSLLKALTGIAPCMCPICHIGTMRPLEIIPATGPP